MTAELTLAELGELGVLARLRPFCTGAIGDDAILQQLPADQALVVTTDVLVDGVHFSDRTAPPHAVGWRAAAANLSDLAAMGAQPLGITVAAALPATTRWAWLEAVYQGMADCLTRYGGEILGGDLAQSPVCSLAITALGVVTPAAAIYRHTAQPGWAVVTTGVHGAARAGLALLLDELEADEAYRQAWIAAHQYPQPRLDAIARLPSLETPIAGMDSSDGLANAVTQLAQASCVGVELMRSRLPIPPGLVETVGPSQAETWTLYGGEDFELVLCLPAAPAADLVNQLGGQSAVIGQTTAAEGVWLVDAQGQHQPLQEKADFQHF
ncbi:MAG: thiamine-phosphate kinase [Leptolyngbya sp. SIO4C1]|nr:thiamine-phosphate kinase [Leptolyngbya sp. SIO4C1]